DVQVLKEDVQELKEDVQVLKEDVQELKGDVQVLKEDVQELEGSVRKLEKGYREIKGRVIRIELNQENVILPRLQTIESCYTSTYRRYKESVEDYETIKQDVSILKEIAIEHSKKIQKIS
ncbi:MAG: hypothetical protein ACI4D2_03390, partial [Lachnospiraceae bacterium]